LYFALFILITVTENQLKENVNYGRLLCVDIFEHIKNKNMDKIKGYCEDGFGLDIFSSSGSTILNSAIKRSLGIEIISYLLDHGADPNAKDSKIAGEWTPLMFSASHIEGNEITSLLISYGADIKQSSSTGNSPLIILASNGNTDLEDDVSLKSATEELIQFIDIVLSTKDKEYLSEAINQKNGNGGSSLTIALYNSNIEMADVLLKHGADINIQNNAGETPLFRIAKEASKDGKGHPNYDKSIKFLLENDVDVSIPSKEGETVFDIASPQVLSLIKNTLLNMNHKDTVKPSIQKKRF